MVLVYKNRVLQVSLKKEICTFIEIWQAPLVRVVLPR